MRSLIYFPPRIHACVQVGCVEAVNIVIKWTPGNSHFYARLDYVKRERSTAAICIFWDSYITWASVALWFGSSTLGARADRLWLSAQTHTHTSNCCASACTRARRNLSLISVFTNPSKSKMSAFARPRSGGNEAHMWKRCTGDVWVFLPSQSALLL